MIHRLHYEISGLRFLLAIGFLVLGCLLSSLPATAQEVAENKPILPPSEEKFRPATDLVSPWRSSGCHFAYVGAPQEPGCHFVTAKEFDNSSYLTIYNADARKWYGFSLTPNTLGYFWPENDKDFQPFATGQEKYPRAVILRMVAESDNWYEVEVNEKTRETKYVLKSDPLWARTTWSYWLYEGTNLYLGQGLAPLRDKPNGKVIEGTVSVRFYADRVSFLKADDDWAYVEGRVGDPPTQRTYKGWIQWRDGRDILVGCYFNVNKVPDVVTATVGENRKDK